MRESVGCTHTRSIYLFFISQKPSRCSLVELILGKHSMLPANAAFRFVSCCSQQDIFHVRSDAAWHFPIWLESLCALGLIPSPFHSHKFLERERDLGSVNERICHPMVPQPKASMRQRSIYIFIYL